MAGIKVIRRTDDRATAEFVEAARGPLREKGYEIVSALANGAKARVCLARKVPDGAVVAVRIYKPPEERKEFHGGCPGALMFRLLRWRLGAGHPNIAALLDSGSIRVTFFGRRHRLTFSVVEMVEGPRLRDAIFDGRLRGFGFSGALRIMTGLTRAVEFLGERGIRHGDVEPQNVILARDGDGRVLPKLIDLVPRRRRLIEFHRRLLSGNPRLNDHTKLHMTLAAVLLGRWEKGRGEIRRIDGTEVMRYWSIPDDRCGPVAALCSLVSRLGPSGDLFRRPTREFHVLLESSASGFGGEQ
ncbi:MAG: hypothetical protein N3A38_11775 [Planctomycetota bacterium]|nr:hypothetical protein [Planctomycetota bacterium]